MIFTPDELDDDSFIAYIADTPTLTRSDEELARYRKPAQTAVPEKVLPSTPPTLSDVPRAADPHKPQIDTDEDAVIRFGFGSDE